MQELRQDILRGLLREQHAAAVRAPVQPGAGVHDVLLQAEEGLRRGAGPLQARGGGGGAADEQQPPDRGLEQLDAVKRETHIFFDVYTRDAHSEL